MARLRFDPSRPLVAARSFTYGGQELHKGDAFDATGLPLHNLKTLYGSRYVDHPDAGSAPSPEQVQIAEAGGGFYDVSAPWLDKPERIRGKEAAQTRVDQLKADGPPLGFIEGGTEVTVEDAGDGKFTVNAPWLEEPETLEGREAAEARQRELNSLGEPDLHHGVRLTDGGNGWFEVKPDWADLEKFEDGEAARARATELRTEGAPQPEPVKVGDTVRVAGEGDPVEGVVTAIEGETAKLRVGEGEAAKELDAPLSALTVVEPPKVDAEAGGNPPPPPVS